MRGWLEARVALARFPQAMPGFYSSLSHSVACPYFLSAPPMPSKAAAAKEPEHTFETALGRLEQIVEEMEADRLPLDDLLHRYEEGTRLVKVCQEKIETAERRIEIITRGVSGKPQLAAFEPSVAQPTAAISTSSPPSAGAAPKAPSAANHDVSLF